jgi:hypothetical protein
MITTGCPAPVVVTYDKKVTYGKNVINGKRPHRQHVAALKPGACRGKPL